MGSRGSHSVLAVPRTPSTPFGAAPFGRTTQAPFLGGRPGAPMPGARRHGFLAGLVGGALGFGLASLLFRHGGLGLVLLVAVIGVLVWSRRQRLAGGPPVPGGATVPLGQADRDAFTASLLAVQRAWTLGDRDAIGRLATPEMVGILLDQIDDLARRGARNSVSDVRIQQASVAETWSEGALDYATIGFRFSAIDITTDRNGRVLDGSPTEHVVTEEAWTFVRRRGGPWVLSAIQGG